MKHRSFLTVLARRDFRLLWIAALTANYSGLVHAVTAFWIIAGFFGSSQMVTLAQTVFALPVVIFLSAGGVLAATAVAYGDTAGCRIARPGSGRPIP